MNQWQAKPIHGKPVRRLGRSQHSTALRVIEKGGKLPSLLLVLWGPAISCRPRIDADRRSTSRTEAEKSVPGATTGDGGSCNISHFSLSRFGGARLNHGCGESPFPQGCQASREA